MMTIQMIPAVVIQILILVEVILAVPAPHARLMMKIQSQVVLVVAIRYVNIKKEKKGEGCHKSIVCSRFSIKFKFMYVLIVNYLL